MTTLAYNLADIYLPTVLGDLLTVTAGETWVVTAMSLGNILATIQTLQLYTRVAATDAFEIQAVLPRWYKLNFNGSLVLPPGAKIRGLTTTANAVRLVVSGYQVEP